MAPRYPVYQRTGRLSLAAATPPRADFAGLRESSRGAQQLSVAADRVVSFASKEVTKQSTARGARDAAQNPRAVLQRFGDRAPSTAYDVAAYNAAVKISAADIEVKARGDIKNALMEWEQNKGDPTALQARLDAITSGYSDVVGELDPVTGATLQTTLNGAGNAAFLSYSETHLKAERDRLRAGVHTLTASVTEGVEIAARNGQEIDSLLSGYFSTAENLQIDPNTIAKNIAAMRILGDRARVRGEFARAKDKAQYISDFVADQGSRTGPARGLPEADQKTMLSEMRATVAGAAGAAKSEIAVSKRSSIEATQAITGGNTVSPATIDDLVEQARATKDEKAIADAERVKDLYDQTSVMSSLNVTAQAALVQQADEFLKSNLAPEELQLANDVLKAREAILSNTRSALKTDQVSHINKFNNAAGIVGPDDVLAAAQGDPSMVNEDFVLASRRRVVEEYAAANSARPLYFSKDEARIFGDFFKDPNTPLSDRLVFLTGIENAFGSRAVDVYEQLDNGKGLMWSQAGGILAATGNTTLIAEVFQGADYLASGGPMPAQSASKSETSATTNDLMNSISSGQQRAQILTLAKNAYLQRQLTGATEDTSADLWRRTLQEVMGATYDGNEHLSGGVVDLDGNNVILSPAMSVSEADYISENLRLLTRDTLSVLVGAEIPDKIMSDYDIKNVSLISAGRANQVRVVNARGEAVGNLTIRLNDLYDALTQIKKKSPYAGFKPPV